ncbi:SET and MYND domain-containing protein 4-like [Belonocnema kinseyi]|uniref:SET and MYND domain-containing protein 4-like n=1 Tax=Belonocnema kinseyi TaxID=2817044 RepID=UPI00143DC2F4|nr:SET and MYND domain-containing protein 4-like [Belonocnema kinseyi]
MFYELITSRDCELQFFKSQRMDYPDPFYRSLCSSETLRSSAKGFFHEFSETVIEQAGDSWIEETFGKLQNDDDRIRTVFTDSRVKTVVLDTLGRVMHLYRDKDATISRNKRLEGLKLASVGEHEKALLFLSQAVLRAPVTGKVKTVDQGLSLPLALLARADTLIALGEYNFALEDLQMADEKDITKTIRDQLQRKKDECRNLSDKSGESLALRKKTESKIGVIPEFTCGQKPDLPGVSNLVEIQESATAGRQAVATMEISPGDTLATEPPLASCLLPEFYGTHCQQCFSRLRAPVGCPECSSVAFCGQKCRDVALSTYHKYECKILALLIGSGMSVLSTVALRMVTQEGLKRCLKIHEKVISRKCDKKIPTVEEKEEVESSESIKMSRSAKRRLRKKKLKESASNGADPASVKTDEEDLEVDDRAYELVTLFSKRTAKDFLERTIMTTFLLKCLQRVGFFDHPSKADEPPSNEETIVGSLLLKNLQVLQFNAHEVYETRLGSEHRYRGSKTIYIGVAIYPTVARFNHDCYGAVTRYFVGRNIVIRALRTLKAGDVVAENYGPVFTKRNFAERQRTLAGRYWFKCSCTACRENWPTFDSMTNISARLRCPTKGCSRLFAQPREENKLLKCLACQKKINLDHQMAELEKTETLYTEGLNLMELEHTEEAVKKFIEALKKFHQVASPPHRMTHLVEIALASCMADGGNIWRPKC